MATKQTKRRPARGRARETGKTRVLTFEMDRKLDEALQAAAERERRTRKAIITIALEQYLQKAQ